MRRTMQATAKIPGNLLTTAMAVMPHRDVDRALECALSLDVPFWPQLPLLDYHEDMYVQASEHFPGIIVDFARRTLSFSSTLFAEQLEGALERFDDASSFDVSESFSAVYHRFLSMDLADRPAIRGQLEGPVSFGLAVLDDGGRPIIYDDTVRPFMMEFMAKRLNAQLARLQAVNGNAFVFIDEPGLQYVFSAMSGYGDQAACRDLEAFFSIVERPRGVHLCGNPDWDFLLSMDIEVLSMDAHTNAEILISYAGSIGRYLERGGVIVWGIVPTGTETLGREALSTMEARLMEIWGSLLDRGIDRDLLLCRSMLSPATCCLVNLDGARTVERAFDLTRDLSHLLREKFRLA